MTRFAALLALIALPQAAAAQTGQCVTRAEVGNLFVFAMPALVDTAIRRCEAALPADAFLRTGGRQLAERLRGEGAADAAGLTATFGKLAGRDVPAGLSTETLQLLVRDIVSTQLANDIKPKDCGKIDTLASALAPLPARNLGTLMVALMELGTSGKKGPFTFCPVAQP